MNPLWVRTLLSLALALSLTACTSSPSRKNYPNTTGYGIINEDMLSKYDSFAVFNFTDAPGAPNSGSVVAGLVTNELNRWGFRVVERNRLDQVFSELRLQLTQSDEKVNQIQVGKLAGAKAIMLGEIGQWETHQEKQRDATSVTLSTRMIDIETGSILFSGEGSFPEPFPNTPHEVARSLVSQIIIRLAIRVGLTGTGTVGYSWNIGVQDGVMVPTISRVMPGLPADEVGVQVGDIIRSCNGTFAWKSEWELRRACRVSSGQILRLNIAS